MVRGLWLVVAFLALIGLAGVGRLAAVLLWPAASSAAKNPAADLDAHFATHRALTLIHILLGVLFMVLGTLQFVSTLRSRHPAVHRWSGRVFLLASAVLGVAGLTMAMGPTIGGWDEESAILLFGIFFLVALAKALWHVLHRESHSTANG